MRTAVRTSLPVYIAIPADVAAMPVPSPGSPLHFNRYADDNNLPTLFDFAVDACHLLASATSSGVLLGHLAARHGVTNEVEELVGRATSRWRCFPWPRATSPNQTRISPGFMPAPPRKSEPAKWLKTVMS